MRGGALTSGLLAGSIPRVTGPTIINPVALGGILATSARAELQEHWSGLFTSSGGHCVLALVLKALTVKLPAPTFATGERLQRHRV